MSSFAERLVQGSFPIAIEITPPKTSKPDILIRRASLANGTIGTVDIVQRVGRQNSLEAAVELANAGFDPIWHLVTNGTSPVELNSVLKHASNSELDQMLIVKGDEPKNHKLTVTETISLVSREYPDIFVGVAFNQYAQPVEYQIKTAAMKWQAGAEYIQTQPIFNLAAQKRTFERLKMTIPDSKLVAMCMPLTSVKTAAQIKRTLGIPIETTHFNELEQGGPEAGWNHFQDMLDAVAQSRIFDGLVIMTYDIDPSPEIRKSIIESIKLI